MPHTLGKEHRELCAGRTRKCRKGRGPRQTGGPEGVPRTHVAHATECNTNRSKSLCARRRHTIQRPPDAGPRELVAATFPHAPHMAPSARTVRPGSGHLPDIRIKRHESDMDATGRS